MFHSGAFFESIDPGGALAFIAAVREDQFFTSGDDFRVPAELPFLMGVAALINDASGVRAQFQSPSLRILAELDVEPIINGTVWGSPPEAVMFPANPLPLAAQESLNLQMDSDPAAAAIHAALFWIADGPQAPVQGNIFTVRATAAFTQVAGVWTNGTLTFSTELPAGTYQVVGMRARAATGLGARLVFPAQTARPGCLVVNDEADEDHSMFRHGRLGMWGQFEHTTPPTLDVFDGTATAQVILLDLLKVA